MIIPLPPKVKVVDIFEHYPWTITLAFLNVLLFWMLFSAPSVSAPKNGSSPVVEKSQKEFDTQFIESAGRYFLEWKNETQFGRQSGELRAFGYQAVRNTAFLQSIETWKSSTDPVGFQAWKKEVKSFFDEEDKKAISIFGLHQTRNELMTWITYQFSHVSQEHLVSNVLFLIFFAACVESLVGGFLMGIIYLVGGFVGGYFFMIMDDSGFIPMVGASASVTALMGFMVTGTTKKNIPYFNSVFCISEMFKIVMGTLRNQPTAITSAELLDRSISYLSPYWIIPLCLLDDLTQILSTPSGWGGGVAHSAHLGGAFAGLMLGLAFRWGSEKSDLLDRSESSS